MTDNGQMEKTAHRERLEKIRQLYADNGYMNCYAYAYGSDNGLRVYSYEFKKAPPYLLDDGVKLELRSDEPVDTLSLKQMDFPPGTRIVVPINYDEARKRAKRTLKAKGRVASGKAGKKAVKIKAQGMAENGVLILL